MHTPITDLHTPYPYWPNSYGLMHMPPADPAPQQRQAFARTRQQMTRFVDDYLRMLRALEAETAQS